MIKCPVPVTGTRRRDAILHSTPVTSLFRRCDDRRHHNDKSVVILLALNNSGNWRYFISRVDPVTNSDNVGRSRQIKEDLQCSDMFRNSAANKGFPRQTRVLVYSLHVGLSRYS